MANVQFVEIPSFGPARFQEETVSLIPVVLINTPQHKSARKLIDGSYVIDRPSTTAATGVDPFEAIPANRTYGVL